ncbi:isochorismate synthase [Trueperella bernardiae]|uniref:isochorismate synthase n=1 Tax=Trueperella bernardiae TaxID=59561 RepID=UPI00294A6D5E|nr:isochorismate synthase [Trueperella bernardiae]MDV6238122.1 isochorismate synthase [Trueperella bernardiae]
MFTIPHLRAQTTALPTPPVLTELMPASAGALAWLKDGRGFIAAGEAARYDHGRDGAGTRFALASQWWIEVVQAAEIRDTLLRPGTGLVSMGSFAFAADSPVGSALIVPQVVVGFDGEVGWLTFIGPADLDVFDTLTPDALALVDAALRPSSGSYASHGKVRADDVDVAVYRDKVTRIQERIAAGSVRKVVLARELQVEAEREIDERYVVARLAAAYPQCWTFAVDGLVGATPELLAAGTGREVEVKVLAGTLPRGEADVQALLDSAKDACEHRLAVESVVEKLEKLGRVEVAPTEVLTLPNVLHLATQVRAELEIEATSLQVAGALHPTAALGGTPTLRALDTIAEIEGIDRDRYGAPVGWMDTRGGEWCIALRCARIEGRQAIAWAGGGIMADSDPDAEYAETEAKLAPVLGVLRG